MSGTAGESEICERRADGCEFTHMKLGRYGGAHEAKDNFSLLSLISFRRRLQLPNEFLVRRLAWNRNFEPVDDGESKFDREETRLPCKCVTKLLASALRYD